MAARGRQIRTTLAVTGPWKNQVLLNSQKDHFIFFTNTYIQLIYIRDFTLKLFLQLH